MLAVFLVALFAIPVQPQAAEKTEVPLGKIVERIVVADDQSQSYAVYLPTTYKDDRGWPILYCFDPDARGVQPVERFKEAAELYGWIVVGSNNSRNGPFKGSVEAGAAMWRDTHARFRIDDRRVYASGFSGGARAATYSAVGCGDCVAGIIACGAGFPPSISPIETPPKQPIRFAYYITAGVDDFNYPELTALQPALEKLGVPSHLARFDGGHDWAPSEVCIQAVGFMETQAMRLGTLHRDEARIDAIYERALAHGRSEESTHHVFEAYVTYTGMVEQFRGLHETSAADARVTALRDSKEVRDAVKSEKEQVRKQSTIVSETVGYAGLIADQDQRAVAMQEFRRRVADLRAKAKLETDSSERRVARRAIHQVFAQFYEGGMNLFFGGKFAQAATSFEIACDISPKAPSLYIDLARARVRAGDRKRALDAIDKAVELGYDEPEGLSDSAFESLRGDARFKQAVDSAASKHAAAKP